MANFWYSYTGANTPTSAYLIPSKYFQTSTIPSIVACPSPQNRPCLIFAHAAGVFPNLTQKLQSYIVNGFITSAHQPSAPVGAKIYLYVRSRI